MPSKRVVQQPRETFKDASNLSANENFTSSSASASSFQSNPRTGYLPTPTVIDPDHTNKRMNPDLQKTDSLVLLSDGDAPSPISPIGFIPTSDGPASYLTFVRQTREQTREATSRREVDKRLADTASEAARRIKEAQTAAAKSLKLKAEEQQVQTAVAQRALNA
jgi:hypothetical protein